MIEKYCYDYPRPAVTTDCIVYDYDDHDRITVLLIKRKEDPYKNMWAFPGGFMDMGETAEECVRRELVEETGITDISLEQVYTATKVDRDPRGRTISVVFLGNIAPSNRLIKPGDDAIDIGWFNIDELPLLAFDHYDILQKVIGRLICKHQSNGLVINEKNNRS